MRFLLALAVALAFSGIQQGQALAWGGEGHRIVAAIAMKLLPPEKADALDKLLRESVVQRGFVDAASCADEVIRDQDHNNDYGDWHYINPVLPVVKQQLLKGGVRLAKMLDENL